LKSGQVFRVLIQNKTRHPRLVPVAKTQERSGIFGTTNLSARQPTPNPNPMNKLTVSPRNKLKYNKDESRTLYFQHKSPNLG